MGIAPIIRLELVSGARSEAERTLLLDRLKPLQWFETTPEVWEEASHLGFLLRRKGVTVTVPDLLIAATCLVYRLTLIHRDRHFEMIAGHSALKTRQV